MEFPIRTAYTDKSNSSPTVIEFGEDEHIYIRNKILLVYAVQIGNSKLILLYEVNIEKLEVLIKK